MEANRLIKAINTALEIDITQNNRKREIVYGRFIFYSIMRRKNKTMSVEKIGKFLNKNHATVLNGLRQFDILKEYSDFRDIINKVENEINKNWVCDFTKLNNSTFEIIRYGKT